jgi:hypothetical protein
MISKFIKYFKIGWGMQKLWLDEVFTWIHGLKWCFENDRTLKERQKPKIMKWKKFWFSMTILTKTMDEVFPGYLAPTSRPTETYWLLNELELFRPHWFVHECVSYIEYIESRIPSQSCSFQMYSLDIIKCFLHWQIECRDTIHYFG